MKDARAARRAQRREIIIIIEQSYFAYGNYDILKVMENYKRSTAGSASIRNRDQDEDVDADLLLPREGERMDNRHPR